MLTLKVNEDNSGELVHNKFKTSTKGRVELAPVAADTGLKSSGLLPPSIRYITQDQRVIVYERPPTRVSIRYTDTDKYAAALRNESAYHYDIPLPWSQYIMHFNQGHFVDMHFGVTAEPLSSFDDPMYWIPLPNTFWDNKGANVCMNGPKVSTKTMTLGKTIDLLVNYMWVSGSNDNAGKFIARNSSLYSVSKNEHLIKLKSHKSWSSYLSELEGMSVLDMLALTPHLGYSSTLRDIVPNNKDVNLHPLRTLLRQSLKTT